METLFFTVGSGVFYVFVLFLVLTGLTVSSYISLLSVCKILVLARFRLARCVVCGRGL